jgi:hypothetical protein
MSIYIPIKTRLHKTFKFSNTYFLSAAPVYRKTADMLHVQSTAYTTRRFLVGLKSKIKWGSFADSRKIVPGERKQLKPDTEIVWRFL